ncbi:MAG: hypothetical protein U1F36_19645 [Planctomycetota bacterium]
MNPRSLLPLALLAGALAAQSNQIPGTDAALATTDGLAQYGHVGTTAGLACGVTVCNVGSVFIHWKAAMDARHPCYAPILCREVNGRFEQISGRSWLKHGFSSINASVCNTCNTSDSTILGVGCSDTYGSGLNANRYWLGPPEEIDPWLGAWTPTGSYFDRGDPDVGAPRNNDGLRSLTQSMADALSPIAHRVQVDDADLAAPGASFWYGMYIVINGEPGTNRDNNAVARKVQPTGAPGSWGFNDLSGDHQGPLLSNWPGATYTSVGNGQDDGSFYVGVKVTGPNTSGLWHYAYAVHNRDNVRGGGSFRLAKCPSVTVSNLSFHDIDHNALTDWTSSVTSTEIAWVAPQGNPIEWNTIYSFSFDADAGPIQGSASIDEARAGAGAATLSVQIDTPGFAYNQTLGQGCGNPLPLLSSYGSPNRALIPNQSFGMFVSQAPALSSGVLLASLGTANLAVGNGCTLFLDTATSFTIAPFGTVSLGFALLPTPVPNDPNLEGAQLTFQSAILQNGGPLFGVGTLTNGLLITIGNGITGCH